MSAMIEVAGREGYARTQIAQVIADAGVSRPTFYEYFEDKEACFLVALAVVHSRELAAVQSAVRSRAPEQALAATIETFLALAEAEPLTARVLVRESVAAGARAREARDQLILEIERVIEAAYEQLSPDSAIPDVSGRMLIGGIHWLLSSKLHRGELEIPALRDGLLGWVASYEQPAGEHRWRTLEPATTPVSDPKRLPLLPPVPAPPGRRRRMSEAEVENQRLRIMFAAAEIAEAKGYRAATIAEISRRAGVDSRAFHRLFDDRQDAFAAVHQLYFEHIMATAAAAFFSAGGSWPERVWEAGQAFTQTVEQNQTMAHIAFVEAHAAGPVAADRLDELLNAFTIFLQEGYEHGHGTPSQLALEAIAATNHELAYKLNRAHGTPHMRGLLPHVTFVVLAPFLGAGEANRFIEEKLKRAAGTRLAR